MTEPGTMTVAEREAFLADVHVGVLAVDEPGRGPHALPIWYLYEDGEVLIGIDGSSRKAGAVAGRRVARRSPCRPSRRRTST